MTREKLIGIKNSKEAKKNKHIFFLAAYILYFVSWFLGDLGTGLPGVAVVEKVLRYGSYLFMLLCLPLVRCERKNWLIFLLAEAVGVYYFVVSRELYLASLVLLIMVSVDEDIRTIFKVSLGIICALVAATLLLCAVGVLENTITLRYPSDPNPRYSLGFYHSNVLPLLLFYMVAYLGVFYNLKINNWVLLTCAVACTAVYFVCGSRTSFIMTLALIAVYAVFPRMNLTAGTQICIYRICRNAILGLSLLTVAFVLLYPLGGKLVTAVNEALSLRIQLGYQKAVNYGFHFLSPLSFAEYAADGIVLDNAYISAMIRYGWISIVILCVVNFFGCEKYKRNTGEMIIFFMVCVVNFIDNDLLTYSCFPFLLAAFNKKEMYKIKKRKQNEERVSVIMSAYNEEDSQLSASIGSILNQTYKNIEFIIVNDNPKNEQLRAVLERFAQKDERIVLVENPENIGLVNSLNKALTYVTGNYVARMDADDIARQDRIGQQMRYLRSNQLDFVGGYIRYIDEENNPLGTVLKVPANHEQICRAIQWGNCIPHPTWLLKREVYTALGGYRHIPHAEDYDFILRALKAGFQVGNVPAIMLNYRIRATGISVSNKVEQNMIRYYLRENRKNIFKVTEEMVAARRADQNTPYYRYEAKKNALKDALKGKHIPKAAGCMCKLLIDRFFWYWIVEKVRFYIYQ